MIETLLIIIIVILLGGGGLIMVLGLGAVAITAIIIGLIIAVLLLAWGTQQLTYIFHPWLIVGCMIALFIYLVKEKKNKMNRLIIFILSGILLQADGVNASEIIIKDCAKVYSHGEKPEFNKNLYANYYFRIDAKNKTISEVWSYTDDALKNSVSGTQKNNIINYKLLFMDNNFATGEITYSSAGYKYEITIDTKKHYVEKVRIFDFKATKQIPMQCKK